MSFPKNRVHQQSQLLTWGRNRLASGAKGKHEARILLEWALDVDSLLKAAPEVGQRAAERYRSAIMQRCRGFPLQHIMGEMYFRNLTLQAGPGVFVVRPETETLVDIAAELIAGQRKPARQSQNRPGQGERWMVIDLCAGSGAVGLSIATEISKVDVTGVELSPVAAAYARRNFGKYEKLLAAGSDYRVVVGDATIALEGQEGQMNMVVSNPPYVPGVPPLSGDLLFDPEMALYGGGEDGLVIPRGIVSRAHELLVPGGWLVMEHAEDQGSALVKIAGDNGFREAQTRQDLTGRNRFLVAQK